MSWCVNSRLTVRSLARAPTTFLEPHWGQSDRTNRRVPPALSIKDMIIMSSIRHSPLLPLRASCVMTQQHLYHSEIGRATCTPPPEKPRIYRGIPGLFRNSPASSVVNNYEIGGETTVSKRIRCCMKSVRFDMSSHRISMLTIKMRLPFSALTPLIWPNGADFDPATLHDWPAHAQAWIAKTREWKVTSV